MVFTASSTTTVVSGERFTTAPLLMSGSTLRRNDPPLTLVTRLCLDKLTAMWAAIAIGCPTTSRRLGSRVRAWRPTG